MKLELTSKKFFDELHDAYYPELDIEEVKSNKEWIHSEYYPFNFDPYELWWYYCYQYVYRFTSGYYDGNYSYKSFEKNMGKALTQWIRTTSNTGLEMVRKELQMIDELDQDYYVVIFPDGHLEFHKVEYIWTTDGNCCEKCEKLNKKSLKNVINLMPHPNCQCGIIMHDYWTDESGKILREKFVTL